MSRRVEIHLKSRGSSNLGPNTDMSRPRPCPIGDVVPAHGAAHCGLGADRIRSIRYLWAGNVIKPDSEQTWRHIPKRSARVRSRLCRVRNGCDIFERSRSNTPVQPADRASLLSDGDGFAIRRSDACAGRRYSHAGRCGCAIGHPRAFARIRQVFHSSFRTSQSREREACGRP